MKKFYSFLIIFLSFYIICNCFKIIEKHGNYKLNNQPLSENIQERNNSWACVRPGVGCHKHESWTRLVDGDVNTSSPFGISYQGGSNLSGTHNINNNNLTNSPTSR